MVFGILFLTLGGSQGKKIIYTLYKYKYFVYTVLTYLIFCPTRNHLRTFVLLKQHYTEVLYSVFFFGKRNIDRNIYLFRIGKLHSQLSQLIIILSNVIVTRKEKADYFCVLLHVLPSNYYLVTAKQTLTI